MDAIIEKLKRQEKNIIVEVMAFMAYNPSIGRVLEKGGVKDFQAITLKKIEKIKDVKSVNDFDVFHKIWVSEIQKKIKTNSKGKNDTCSYGQAQKPINVFLKLYVDWASLPDSATAKRIRPWLHVPLDSILMKELSKVYDDYFKKEIYPLQKSSWVLSKITQPIYEKWQILFREKYPIKPLLFDIVWAANR